VDTLEAIFGSVRCRVFELHIRQSSGGRWLSWCNRDECLESSGVRPSTGSVGGAYENTMCEGFFATLECELLDRHRFRSHSEARMAVFRFIEGFYNPSRRQARP
jgi:putative transposase